MYYSRWATTEEVANLTETLDPKSQIKESGIPLGYAKEKLNILKNSFHTIVFGSIGSGKTQAMTLPLIRLSINAGESFIVNDSGRWLFYRTHNYWQEWIFLHIVHNWLDIWEQNNYEDIFWLFNYKNNVLYFFKKNWKIFYNLNWENFDTDYDDIMHDWCCGMGSYNMFFWDWAMLIYAKKNWKYYLIKWAFVED